MSNYNVLLASPGTASGVLCSAASIMWNWNALVRGENLTGKHFNQPPDGPYGSWYGHFKVPLEDPFSVVEQPSSPQAEELSEPGLDSKLRPIPRIVMRQIRHILNSYPKGFPSQNSVQSWEKLQSRGDGQYCVQRIASKAPEPVESIALYQTKGQRASNKSGGASNKEEEPPPLGQKVAETTNAHAAEEHLSPVEGPESSSEVGFFKKIWRKWFSSKDGGFEKEVIESLKNVRILFGVTSNHLWPHQKDQFLSPSQGPVSAANWGQPGSGTGLIDGLRSDVRNKKWVEENPTQTSPFKVIRPVGKKSTSSQPHVSNGLSSIFLGTQSQSNLQRQLEHGEKRDQNLPHTGVSQPVIDKKMLDRSRSEILAHCQKLVDEILKEYPEGFNMGAFRKLFLERYGYSLDVQKLGYQRLASLLQIMPGVKTESTYIVPSWTASKGSLLESFDTNGQENNGSGKVGNSDSELSDASRKEDDLDSPWEELGPVADTNSNRNEMESELRRKKKEETVRQVHLDYEPSPSDDDFSDSEGETLLSTGTDRQERPKISKEDSSLLRILDSWYSSKEDNKRRDGVENADGMIDCSRNDLKSSGSSGFFSEDDTSPINCRKKQRPVRSYSFVSDHGDDKDKLIDGILGSLKKSGESRMHS
ncbi:hypothetical protein CK203_080336 [Vitis vinifera]|uniref:HTH OST-type domain-containing protein n=1 Tax=Vitis vinifera TaxID=29760 RepID=A0A438CNN8_VITVI|nr:hypothetical protein CK203_080336 [Vitis vinifera]